MKNEENYHHGDLRAALLKAAHQRLSNSGYESLSLRELARDAGVAVSAPYFHFKNRDDLFAALIQDGANDQKRRFSRAAALPGSNQDRLVAACRSHLEFAKRKKELVRLTFVAPPRPDPAFRDDVRLMFKLFEALVAAAMDPRDPRSAELTAVACWSLMHGYAMLTLHKRLGSRMSASKTDDAIIAAVLRLVGDAI